MRVLRNGVLAVAFLMMIVPAFGQSTEAPQAAPTEPASPQAPASPRPRRIAEAPCWKQAGLTADMVNRRWKIEDQSKVKIEAVCNEPATSAKQKQTKIEEIHTETDQELAKLIPSKELQVFNSCQAALDKKQPKPAKVLGPCGGVIPSTDSTPGGMDHEHH